MSELAVETVKRETVFTVHIYISFRHANGYALILKEISNMNYI